MQLPFLDLELMSLAATPGGLCQLLSNPLTCLEIGMDKFRICITKNCTILTQIRLTSVSANSSTLPNDSIFVKSGPIPVIIMLTASFKSSNEWFYHSHKNSILWLKFNYKSEITIGASVLVWVESSYWLKPIWVSSSNTHSPPFTQHTPTKPKWI